MSADRLVDLRQPQEEKGRASSLSPCWSSRRLGHGRCDRETQAVGGCRRRKTRCVEMAHEYPLICGSFGLLGRNVTSGHRLCRKKQTVRSWYSRIRVLQRANKTRTTLTADRRPSVRTGKRILREASQCAGSPDPWQPNMPNDCIFSFFVRRQRVCIMIISAFEHKIYA